MTNFPVGPGRSDLVVEWMRDMEWSLATVSPVFLATLIRTSQEKGIDPKTDWKLKRAVIGGQSVSRAFRDELEAGLPQDFMTFNTYGTTEAGGPIDLRCIFRGMSADATSRLEALNAAETAAEQAHIYADLAALMSDASEIAPAVDSDTDLSGVELPASCPALSGG